MRSSSDSEERNDRAGPPAKRSRRTTVSSRSSALAVSWSSPSLVRLLLRVLARGVVAAAVRYGCPFCADSEPRWRCASGSRGTWRRRWRPLGDPPSTVSSLNEAADSL